MSQACGDGEESNDMTMSRCASCGIAEGDDIKLKKCNGCHLVRYCGVVCQKDHMPQHKRACEQRAAELRDEILFKQPEKNHNGDCPICMLPLSPSLDFGKCVYTTCCIKTICDGCSHSYDLRNSLESKEPKCPFCRHPKPKLDEESEKNIMKRVESNDPAAMFQMGTLLEKRGDNNDHAFQYLSKAAALGDAGAHYHVSFFFEDGKVVEKDEKKKVYHLEQAAIGGHVFARRYLAIMEYENGRTDRATRHCIIAAKLGDDDSMELLKGCVEDGSVSEEDFAATLRAHQAIVEATKSPQREEAEAFRKFREAKKAARGRFDDSSPLLDE